ncbi:c-type cytochrome [Leptospira sp. GIMC2001]|uniref:c-type cytochrome n=1 Tax=Leptospira sp. GIMC2001 TaxID=1513297 RepID=UPI00234965F4|nr:c-type cytochrome [Leptospira sp. GIMC2001]WCL48582.1 c-type cytochrome [Leptospira sp. GIMC2001]
MKTKISLTLLVIASSLMFLVACGDKPATQETASPAPTEVAALDADTQAGKEAYDMSCASCHGELGAGDGAAASALNPKPRNYKAPASEWKNGPTLAGVTKTLNEGIKGTSMVAYKHLGDETIGQIAKYVVYLNQN